MLLNIENGYYFISLDPVQTNHSRAVPLAVNNWHPTSFDVYQHCSLARLQPGLHVQIHTINNYKIVLIYIYDSIHVLKRKRNNYLLQM